LTLGPYSSYAQEMGNWWAQGENLSYWGNSAPAGGKCHDATLVCGRQVKGMGIPLWPEL
jgi:predicted aconitase with swiveling domain